MSGRAPLSVALAPLARVSAHHVDDVPARRVPVSVVIPNYNYARFLPASVGSALSQDGIEVEVIIVDDASTDESGTVMAALAADPRVRTVTSSQNRGAVATFNAGLRRAEGDYVVRLDADDVLSAGSVARAVALGERFPNVGLIYGRPVHFRGAIPSRTPRRASGWTIWSGEEWLRRRFAEGVNCITSPEAVMRAKTIHAAGGGQLEQLRHAHDMEMFLRLARFGDVGHVDGVDQAYHREHGLSFSAREVDVLGDMRHRQQVFAALCLDDTESSRQLHDLARRALANEAVVRATQAFSRGRGDSLEVESYLAFAHEMTVPLDELPATRYLLRAQELGPRRAPWSPSLLARALHVRSRERRAARRTLRTGA